MKLCAPSAFDATQVKPSQKLFSFIVMLSLMFCFANTTEAASFSLTEAEQEWLNKHQTIRLSGPQAFPPFQYYSKDGVFQGIATDYIFLIAQMIGLHIEIAAPQPWPQILQKIQNQQIDVLSCAGISPERDGYLNYTQPYLSFPLIIVNQKDAPFISNLQGLHNQRVVFVNKSMGFSLLEGAGINFTPSNVASPTEAMKAVSMGKADAYIENLATASYLIEHYGLANLKIAAPTSFDDYALSIAVRKDWPELVTIFNKALDAIPREKHNEIIQKWIAIRFDHGIQTQDIIEWGLSAAFVALLFAGFFLSWNKRLKAEITIRKQTEERLQDEIASRRLLIESSNDGIVLIDEHCKVVEANQCFAELIGYPLAEVSELHIWDWDGQFNKADILSLATGINKSGHQLTTQFHCKDGQIKDIELSNSAIIYKGQKLIFCICRDMTARLTAEKLLKESESKFRIAFQTSPDAINLTRLDGTYVDVNEGFLALTGYLKEEVIGKSSLELNIWKHSGDRDRLIRLLAKDGYVENLEAEFLTKDSKVTHGLISARRIELEGEQIILTITRDITERKLTEEKYKILVTEANTGIALADTETGIIIECNQALANMVERSREEILGKHQSILHPENQRSPDVKTYNFINRKTHPNSVPIVQQCITSSGKLIDVEIRAKQIEYAGRTMLLAIFYDLSELLHLQNQLRQKYKMEAVGLMAGGIAHNFNNALAAILGSLEMAKRRLDNPGKLLHYIDTATKAALRSRDLVSQILTYSRQDASQRGPTNIALVVEETLNLIQSTLPATIELKASNDLIKGVEIIADSSQIQEALLNLCNNAVHAMDEKGTLSIHLSMAELKHRDLPADYEAVGGKFVKLSVSDTGCGISAAAIEKIFDPFFTTKGIGQGTGMGLATVQGIVKQHNGFIRVDSSVGTGTTFELFFPFSDVSTERQEQQAAPIS